MADMEVDPPVAKGKKEAKEAKQRFEVKKVSSPCAFRNYQSGLHGFAVERCFSLGLG